MNSQGEGADPRVRGIAVAKVGEFVTDDKDAGFSVPVLTTGRQQQRGSKTACYAGAGHVRINEQAGGAVQRLTLTFYREDVLPGGIHGRSCFPNPTAGGEEAVEKPADQTRGTTQPQEGHTVPP